MLSARFSDMNVLPSPGTALATIMRLPSGSAVTPRPSALLINGRLMLAVLLRQFTLLVRRRQQTGFPEGTQVQGNDALGRRIVAVVGVARRRP